VLDDGVTGFIVSTQDEAVEAVAKLGRLSRAQCRSVFERRFSARCMAEAYVRLYQLRS
jgi:glycosyltransferase involved in cell wall biosynthesis